MLRYKTKKKSEEIKHLLQVLNVLELTKKMIAQ